MTPSELRARTKQFADGIVAFCTPLLDHSRTREEARQLLRSGTAVNANYRSAQSARSPIEFAAKIGQVLDDANESLGWLELLRDSGLVNLNEAFQWLLSESGELTRIFAASFRTARRNARRRQAQLQKRKFRDVVK